jgi:hypothetical protein
VGVAIGLYDAFEDVSGWKSVSSSSLNFDGGGKTVMGWGRIEAEEGWDDGLTYLNKVPDAMPAKATRYARRILKRILKAQASKDV